MPTPEKGGRYFSPLVNLIVLPLFINLICAASSLYNKDELGFHTSLCYLTTALAVAPSLATLIGFGFTKDLKPMATLMTLVAHGGVLIVIFAGIYQGHGLLHGGPTPQRVEFWTAVYFSVITWTTVGYGDYSPPTDIQMIAATQALLGYIFLGTSVGIITAILGNNHMVAVATATAIVSDQEAVATAIVAPDDAEVR